MGNEWGQVTCSVGLELNRTFLMGSITQRF